MLTHLLGVKSKAEKEAPHPSDYLLPGWKKQMPLLLRQAIATRSLSDGRGAAATQRRGHGPNWTPHWSGLALKSSCFAW